MEPGSKSCHGRCTSPSQSEVAIAATYYHEEWVQCVLHRHIKSSNHLVGLNHLVSMEFYLILHSFSCVLLIALNSQLFLELDFFDCILFAMLSFLVVFAIWFAFPCPLCAQPISSVLASESNMLSTSVVEFEACFSIQVPDLSSSDSGRRRLNYDMPDSIRFSGSRMLPASS